MQSDASSKITYTLKRNKRLKYIRLRVNPDSTIEVAAPYIASATRISQFVESKVQWIIDRLNYFKRFKVIPITTTKRKHYEEHKEKARVLIHERLAFFNTIYTYKYNRVSIKNTTSRWGSCSTKGNLNFNYQLCLLPQELCDYVVVHELCHLKEHNHGPNFWKLVAIAIPDYKERRRDLKRYRM